MGALVVCGVLGGCGFEEAPKPPNGQEVVEAMHTYVADREGNIDAKGRYKGPRVTKVADLKCSATDEKNWLYRCSMKYTVKRRVNEEETAEHSFKKIPIKIEERGKEVERKMWRVVGK